MLLDTVRDTVEATEQHGREQQHHGDDAAVPQHERAHEHLL